MKKVAVLGCGLVGREIALDLARYYEVTAYDRDPAVAGKLAGSPVRFQAADLSRPGTIQQLAGPYDSVVGALPGFMGFRCLQAVIEAGKPVVDIAFFPEDPFLLDELARRHNVPAIVDFGVAPGMSNLFAGYHQARLKTMDRLEILVGGLPVVREFPFEYRAVFSPVDVLEEYTRPARYIEHGREVVRPALTDPEMVFFEGVGTLESFNTDGLRTLMRTIRCPFMKEKTLRYPGHIRLMQALLAAGFFSNTPLDWHGRPVIPLEFNSRLLFDSWKMRPEDEDFTVMRITIEGTDDSGTKPRIVYSLLDRFDRQRQIPSMTRTTGYAATAAARLLTDGLVRQPGILPPEYLGQEEPWFKFVLEHLAERNVIYQCTITKE